MVFRKRKQLSNGTVKEYPHYWYKFTRDGKVVRRNTKQSNRRTAEELEATHRTRLARGEADLPVGKAPTLAAFNPVLTSRTGKARSSEFYASRLKALLAFPPLANARLSDIDEPLIEKYLASRREEVSPATLNRELATLSKALRLARDKKLIHGLPKIRREPGEHHREFVLKPDDQGAYLGACPDPLRDVAALVLETALRLGEALALTWADVVLEPSDGKKFGWLHVRVGKTKSAERVVSLTAKAAEVLKTRKVTSTVQWIFPNEKQTGPALVNSVGHQHKRVRDRLVLNEGFVVHSLRHTALTRLGEAGVDVFTLKRIAGHSSVTTSERYVHPSDSAMEAAFERLQVAQRGHLIGTPAHKRRKHVVAKMSVSRSKKAR